MYRSVERAALPCGRSCAKNVHIDTRIRTFRDDDDDNDASVLCERAQQLVIVPTYCKCEPAWENALCWKESARAECVCYRALAAARYTAVYEDIAALQVR